MRKSLPMIFRKSFTYYYVPQRRIRRHIYRSRLHAHLFSPYCKVILHPRVVLVYLQSACVHTRQSRQRCRIKSRVTFAQGIIPFARQCTYPPGLTADIHFLVVTVGHRRKRVTRSRSHVSAKFIIRKIVCSNGKISIRSLILVEISRS